jgi:hypothetical protein
MMDLQMRVEQLERKLQYLSDRSEILDCIARNARGCDRFDSALLTSAYHEDGVDEHGNTLNRGPEFAEWANAAHGAMFLQNMHHITTHSCEIDGDIAHAESYSLGMFLDREGQTARIIAGRYADRLERRNGEWRIVLRRTTTDVLLSGDASALFTSEFQAMGYVKGTRDKRDVAYQRPLSLDDDQAERW